MRDFLTTEASDDTHKCDGQKISSFIPDRYRKNNVVTLNVPPTSDMTLKVPDGAYKTVTGGGLVKDVNAASSNRDYENVEGQNKLISVVYYNDKGSNGQDDCANAPTELLSLYYQGGSQNIQVPNQPLQIVISAKHVENRRTDYDSGEEKALHLLKKCQPNNPSQGITMTLSGNSANRTTKSGTEAEMASNDLLLHIPENAKLKRSDSSSTVS